MQHLPETEKAFRQGALTELQAIEVVSAAMVDNASEDYLLELAELESMARLHEQASRVRAAAMTADEKARRAHKRRELRHWTDIEGVFRLAARLTPESGAVVMACLQPFLQQITRKAAKEKIKERAAAHMADALVEMAERSRCVPPDALRPGPGAVVHLRLDYAAIERGYLKPGEICEVPGIGPIPLQAAKAFLGDSYRVGILMDGEDIRSVKGLGHNIPERLRRAVFERDNFRCVVPGCSTDYCGHDIDHVIPVDKGGETKLYNLALLCRWHHGLKTHHGHRLQHYKHRGSGSGPTTRHPTRTRSSRSCLPSLGSRRTHWPSGCAVNQFITRVLWKACRQPLFGGRPVLEG
jgi:hypothetical protein